MTVRITSGIKTSATGDRADAQAAECLPSKDCALGLILRGMQTKMGMAPILSVSEDEKEIGSSLSSLNSWPSPKRLKPSCGKRRINQGLVWFRRWEDRKSTVLARVV